MNRIVNIAIVVLLLPQGAWLAPNALAATLSFTRSEPFGTLNGIDFEQHSGRVSGETALGQYDVPFEIIAPADARRGIGAVLVEPAHWFFGPVARDQILGHSLLFGSGFSHAVVGWGHNGLNVLDPSAAPIVVAGFEVVNPGEVNFGSPVDSDIVAQFVNLLKSDPEAVAVLGADPLWYAFGVSQTSSAVLQVLLGPDGAGLFDLNLVLEQFWPEIIEPFNFDRLAGEFEPPVGVGRTIIVNTESELVRSDAEQFRVLADDPDSRVYELAGAPHFPQPPPLNPLPVDPSLRAAFVAGDAWVRLGIQPPQSQLIGEATGIDPIYGFETGIARDLNGNAAGGVRLPDVEVGRATFIATNFVVPIPGFDPELFGLWVDLQCVPLPDGSVRFANHGAYVSAVAQHASGLVQDGYLLAEDAVTLKQLAARSQVGQERACE